MELIHKSSHSTHIGRKINYIYYVICCYFDYCGLSPPTEFDIHIKQIYYIQPTTFRAMKIINLHVVSILKYISIKWLL